MLGAVDAARCTRLGHFLSACLFALIFLSFAMGIKSLQVVLRDTVEGGPGVFFSGSTITGVVRISVEGESQAVKGILPLGSSNQSPVKTNELAQVSVCNA